MLDDFFEAFNSAFNVFWPYVSSALLIFLPIYGLLFVIRSFSRLLFDGRPVHINWGIKDLFLKVVNKVLPFEWCYKMGWARPGIDFVECESQDCSTCPFNGKCTSDLREDCV